jgi:hypothetical protein
MIVDTAIQVLLIVALVFAAVIAAFFAYALYELINNKTVFYLPSFVAVS